MKTEAIIEHWFGEEAEESDQSGGQCGHEDDKAEEEMATTMTGLNKSNLLSRFMESIEDDKYLRDIDRALQNENFDTNFKEFGPRLGRTGRTDPKSDPHFPLFVFLPALRREIEEKKSHQNLNPYQFSIHHNFRSGAPIDKPFAAMRSSWSPLQFYLNKVVYYWAEQKIRIIASPICLKPISLD
ncbi:hypothetical protein AHAS_Ahas02G0091300 [Arachis hypogaea]